MKKKLLAAAVVGALASPAAFAQTLYGLLDVGFQNADYSDEDVRDNFIQTGMHSGSRFGVRGSEDLAGGLYAMYQIEFDITADTGATNGSGHTQRLTFVGLGNKSWGELTLGRQYTHTFHTFAVGSSIGYGTFASMYTNSQILTRASNSVKYSSPNFNGFTIGALWAPGGATGGGGQESTAPDEDDLNDYMDFAVRYTPGPFGVSVSHATRQVTADDDRTHTQIAANWNAGAWGVYGALQKVEDDSIDTDADIWHINAVFRFGGRHEIHGLFGHAEYDQAGDEAEGDLWGIVYQHLLSKRTRIYVGYGQGDNDEELIGTAGILEPSFLAGTPTVDDPSAFQIGLLHTF